MRDKERSVVQGNGWLTPDGEFIPSEPASPIHYAGMPHTGHSKAFLEWIDLHRPDIAARIEEMIPPDGDISDLPRQDVIDHAVQHGFVRVVDDQVALQYEGRPTPLQIRILKLCAKQRNIPLRAD